MREEENTSLTSPSGPKRTERARNDEEGNTKTISGSFYIRVSGSTKRYGARSERKHQAMKKRGASESDGEAYFVSGEPVVGR